MHALLGRGSEALRSLYTSLPLFEQLPGRRTMAQMLEHFSRKLETMDRMKRQLLHCPATFVPIARAVARLAVAIGPHARAFQALAVDRAPDAVAIAPLAVDIAPIAGASAIVSAVIEPHARAVAPLAADIATLAADIVALIGVIVAPARSKSVSYPAIGACSLVVQAPYPAGIASYPVGNPLAASGSPLYPSDPLFFSPRSVEAWTQAAGGPYKDPDGHPRQGWREESDASCVLSARSLTTESMAAPWGQGGRYLRRPREKIPPWQSAVPCGPAAACPAGLRSWPMLYLVRR